MIRILIADDHMVVREGLKRIFAGTDDIVVAAEACAGQEVLALVAADVCDIVLLDISLPDMSGLEVLKHLKQTAPTLPILMLSVHPEQQYAMRALKTGAAGYLTKDSGAQELTTAVRKVVQGERYIGMSMAAQLALDMVADTPPPLYARLSTREYEVLVLLGEGKTVKEIAYDLSLSIKTVSTYRQRLLKKMHMKTNAELMRYAIQHLLV